MAASDTRMKSPRKPKEVGLHQHQHSSSNTEESTRGSEIYDDTPSGQKLPSVRTNSMEDTNQDDCNSQVAGLSRTGDETVSDIDSIKNDIRRFAPSLLESGIAMNVLVKIYQTMLEKLPHNIRRQLRIAEGEVERLRAQVDNLSQALGNQSSTQTQSPLNTIGHQSTSQTLGYNSSSSNTTLNHQTASQTLSNKPTSQATMGHQSNPQTLGYKKNSQPSNHLEYGSLHNNGRRMPMRMQPGSAYPLQEYEYTGNQLNFGGTNNSNEHQDGGIDRRRSSIGTFPQSPSMQAEPHKQGGSSVALHVDDILVPQLLGPGTIDQQQHSDPRFIGGSSYGSFQVQQQQPTNTSTYSYSSIPHVMGSESSEYTNRNRTMIRHDQQRIGKLHPSREEFIPHQDGHLNSGRPARNSFSMRVGHPHPAHFTTQLVATNHEQTQMSGLYVPGILPHSSQSVLLAQPDGTKAEKGSKWTLEQDQALRAAVTVFKESNWKQIAHYVPGRDHVQCLQRWKKVLRPGLVKGAWSAQEDKILLQLTRGKEKKNWAVIANSVPGRTAKQCRERWSLNLDPSINRSPWTAQEDALLLTLHKSHGNKWAAIKRELKGRTENAVKTRFTSLQRKIKKHKEKQSPKSKSDVESLEQSSAIQVKVDAQSQQTESMSYENAQDLKSDSDSPVVNARSPRNILSQEHISSREATMSPPTKRTKYLDTDSKSNEISADIDESSTEGETTFNREAPYPA